ncbi:MAG: hypothetical protein D6780_07545 [Candidatus Dadabacteria bacterium]|nr:MAG: hypothetical protein D6780_07545 [Candidatus Dadabacteria bacterium]
MLGKKHIYYKKPKSGVVRDKHRQAKKGDLHCKFFISWLRFFLRSLFFPKTSQRREFRAINP